MALGENLRGLRARRGMTQPQLANALHVSPQAVSRWENNIALPDAAMLCAIADALDVSLDRLLGRARAAREDAYAAMLSYLRALEPQRQMEGLFDLSCYGEAALFAHPESEYWEAYYRKRDWDLDGNAYSSCCEADSGFTYGSHDPALPFFAVFPEPEAGWRASIRPDARIREALELLADPDVYRTLFCLYRLPRGFSFDARYAEASFGLTDPLPVLDRLTRLGVLYADRISAGGASVVIWSFTARCGVIALLTVLREFVLGEACFALQTSQRARPYL